MNDSGASTGSPRLTIRELSARAVVLTPPNPVETANEILHQTPLVLLDLMTEEGITGRSYVRCYAAAALLPLTLLIRNLSPLLKGDRAAPLMVEKKLHRHFRLLGPQGLAGIAMAGIDMALWDALARACDLPLVSLLGGAVGPVPAYAALRSMSSRGAAADAEAALSLGFTAVKVKIGRGELAADLETIRAVRRAVGDKVSLMVDYNQSLSVAEACDRARVLDDEGVAWIEEPTRANDFVGHARIAQAARTAVQLGENCWGPHDIAKSIAAGASDHLMFDAMKIGGVSGWMRAAALADAAGLPVSSHTFPEISAHLLAASPTAHLLEYIDHVGPILQMQVAVKDGYVMLSDGSGSGMAWDEGAVQAALVGDP
jgi:mandelate racemase